jgi:hypothetical protein
MQSTGQTSRQASQPVQLSALITATSLGSFLRAPDFAITFPVLDKRLNVFASHILEADDECGKEARQAYPPPDPASAVR